MQWIYIICFALISAGLLALFGVRPGDFIDALFRSQRKAATLSDELNVLMGTPAKGFFNQDYELKQILKGTGRADRYSDLFQEGCVWLCKAAATFKDDGRAQFATYAKTVVKNGLLSYCRTICNRGKMFSRLIIGEHGELAADGEVLEAQSDVFDAQVSLMETLSLLEASKQDYDGVARLGIEALALKLQGMRVTDIAELYQVPPSHVGAWISRSVAKLRSDPRFLASLL